MTFYNNGQSIGTGPLSVVNGQEQATFTTNTLSTASHSITAVYTSGDANFLPSPVSSAVTQVVNKANTSATVVTSASPTVYGQAVTLTATVSIVSPGSTAVASPTGTVTFYDNGTAIGTGTLSVVSGQDQATLTTSALEHIQPPHHRGLHERRRQLQCEPGLVVRQPTWSTKIVRRPSPARRRPSRMSDKP